MVETLSKFGVPLGDGTGRGGLLQLKYAYRFRVRVVNFGPIAGGLEITQQVQSVGKPHLEHEVIEVHSYNSTGYFAGKHKWGTISLVLKDDVTNACTALVGHQVQKQLNHLEQTGYLAGSNYKFTMLIETLDGGNSTVLETWYCEGCFISEFEEEGMDYKNGGEFQTMTLTIRCDNITMTNGLMPDSPDKTPGDMV